MFTTRQAVPPRHTSLREFLKSTGWVAMAWALSAGAIPYAQASERSSTVGSSPNVLILMTDQHRPDLMTCAGNNLVPTPNLDRIAVRGVRFQRAYCPYPGCAPSRMSLLTGLYPHNHRVLTNADCLDWHVRTIAHEFADHGYLTGLIGKMHFNDGHQRGFTYRVTINDWLMYLGPKVQLFADEIANYAGSPRYFETVFDDGSGLPEMRGLWNGPSPWIGKVKQFDFSSVSSRLAADDHLDAFVAREATKFLRQYHEQPFFLVVGFMKPHAPFFPPRPWADQYPLDKIVLPPVGDIRGYPEHVRQQIARMQSVGEKGLRAIRAGYLGNLAFVDTCVGQVYKALEELGLAEQTIVVYTSDHGEMGGDHGLFQKMCMFEPSVGVPLIVSRPGSIPQGCVARGIVEHLGLYATLMELLGWTSRTQLDGRSFADLLRNPDAPGQQAAFAEYDLQGPVNRFMIRTDRFKYVYNHGSTPELYDEQADPGEFVNLAGQPEMKEMQDRLHRQLVQWYDPERNPFRTSSSAKKRDKHSRVNGDGRRDGTPHPTKSLLQPGGTRP